MVGAITVEITIIIKMASHIPDGLVIITLKKDVCRNPVSLQMKMEMNMNWERMELV